ncbi:hypothetical protein H9P43_001137 [Blastocladiella emersonii ATCC 22665]|nr:hypothetical protein H9P43_001137 [Blastocladiella emersonii ATCC 22665]
MYHPYAPSEVRSAAPRAHAALPSKRDLALPPTTWDLPPPAYAPPPAGGPSAASAPAGFKVVYPTDTPARPLPPRAAPAPSSSIAIANHPAPPPAQYRHAPDDAPRADANDYAHHPPPRHPVADPNAAPPDQPRSDPAAAHYAAARGPGAAAYDASYPAGEDPAAVRYQYHHHHRAGLPPRGPPPARRPQQHYGDEAGYRYPPAAPRPAYPPYPSQQQQHYDYARGREQAAAYGYDYDQYAAEDDAWADVVEGATDPADPTFAWQMIQSLDALVINMDNVAHLGHSLRSILARRVPLAEALPSSDMLRTTVLRTYQSLQTVILLQSARDLLDSHGLVPPFAEPIEAVPATRPPAPLPRNPYGPLEPQDPPPPPVRSMPPSHTYPDDLRNATRPMPSAPPPQPQHQRMAPNPVSFVPLAPHHVEQQQQPPHRPQQSSWAEVAHPAAAMDRDDALQQWNWDPSHPGTPDVGGPLPHQQPQARPHQQPLSRFAPASAVQAPDGAPTGPSSSYAAAVPAPALAQAQGAPAAGAASASTSRRTSRKRGAAGASGDHPALPAIVWPDTSHLSPADLHDMQVIRSKRLLAGHQLRSRKRVKMGPPVSGRCHSCNATETPEWRRGPDGRATLCNACGLHWAKLQRQRDQPQRDADADDDEDSDGDGDEDEREREAGAADETAADSGASHAPPPPPPERDGGGEGGARHGEAQGEPAEAAAPPSGAAGEEA